MGYGSLAVVRGGHPGCGAPSCPDGRLDSVVSRGTPDSPCAKPGRCIECCAPFLPMKPMQFDTVAARELDKRNAAYHEAGHFVVAHYFNLSPWCYIVERGEAPFEECAFTGQCWRSRTTPFRAAVIGWAGMLAEEMYGQTADGWKEAIMGWEFFEEEMSASDLRVINGHPMRWRAFKTSVGILYRNSATVHAVAARLMENGSFRA